VNLQQKIMIKVKSLWVACTDYLKNTVYPRVIKWLKAAGK